ncbi:hypothetical protein [Streptomyces sp. NPDC087212]|uniref:hypothetical protein n=1 Tax=Streptomyces sp. NPDC087212 TaxID=3365766 RepID=UPI0037F5228E
MRGPLVCRCTGAPFALSSRERTSRLETGGRRLQPYSGPELSPPTAPPGRSVG